MKKKSILIALLAFLCLSVKAQSDTSKNYNWSYRVDINQMTNDKRYYADVYSEPSKIVLSIRMLVRYMNKKNDVLLFLDGALYDSSVYGNYIQVKFDNGKIENYRCYVLSSSQFKMCYISKSDKFINELKMAKKILIQAPIYGQGSQVFKFDVDELKWDYK